MKKALLLSILTLSFFTQSRAQNCTSFSATVQATQTSCGLPNGSLVGNATGGVTPYTYLWSNGATAATLQNLNAGTYTLTVTASNGCTATASATLSNSICPKVNTAATVSNITQNGATINWPAISCANKYRVVVKNVSTGVQTTTLVSAPNTSLNLTGLSPSTTYQIRIRTQCSTNGTVVSQLSPIASFTTLNSQGIQCLPPSIINPVVTTTTTATINWNAAAGAVQYNIRYRTTGTTAWTALVIAGTITGTTIQNLIPGTAYEYQIRTKCNSNPDEFSPYSAILSFSTTLVGVISTLGCADAVNNGTLTAGSAANSVSSVVPYTGGNGGTHSGQTVTSTGVTGLTATLTAGTFANGIGSLTYTISGTPASSGTASFALSIGGQTCTLTRTVSNLDCSAPVISSTNSLFNSSTVIWDAVTGAQEYRLRYRIGSCTLPNNNPWIDSITIGGSFTQYTINGLTAGTNYECQIKSRCSITPSVFSSYSALATISTGSPVNTVSSLNCASAVVNGTVNVNQAANANIVVPYTGGNNTFYSYEIVNSTGVTGLVATRDQGTLNWCSGVVTYYISGMATNCGQANFAINLGGQTCTISLPVTCCPATVTDIDGNVYQAVQIGNQCWTKENLRTTRYNNGSVIPNVTSDDAWENLSSPAWCNYYNSPASDAVYGKLYNWYTVAAGNLCPTGWHVPTDAEWTVLTNFLGGTSVAGGKMKSTTGWNAPNTAATNESGFSGLPGGARFNGFPSFEAVGDIGFWWSSTESSTTNAWYRGLAYDDGGAVRFFSAKWIGFSVRCLRD